MPIIYQKFKNSLQSLLKGEKNIAIALSGGSDSMALTLLLNDFNQESSLKITALTVDHKLRSGIGERS